ncbi:Hda2p Ecym_3189 [Eremothecium cymbalariae DBVPG|uniref:HDA1 complex subunit 2 n=1 Tax=Eremothecium cymbalariae (strain CBS 270.75 / DBVPG 7215 / KCTC 17166 / NRRL Y-17582) TaxID=931890 RepID=G8JRB9_ERECY|nr:Hypothetical protein Ecym_3189 [Eremothecium cymbalariae DBVPG\
MNLHDSGSQVYYMPVGLTELQKDLIEILICMHAESFLEEYSPEAVERLLKGGYERNGVDEKMELTMAALTPTQMNMLLLQNIRAVANHPCLLVDHYMPRKFLLMEPGQELISTSDKFKILDQLVELILCRDNRDRPLQLAVISHSVKELDLIEGFMLGKLVKLKRLSGTSLFDEKHQYAVKVGTRTNAGGDGTNNNYNTVYKDNSPSSVEGKLSSRAGISSTNVAGLKDDYDYQHSKKFSLLSNLRNRDSYIEDKDWLFLATATHLTHCEDLFENYDLDIIISFDPMLNEMLPSVYNVRNGPKSVPLIKLLVQNSPEHFMLATQHKFDYGQDDLHEALAHFIRHRNNYKDYEGISTCRLKEFVASLLSSGNISMALADTQLSQDNCTADIVESLLQRSILMNLQHTDYTLPQHHGEFDTKCYQAKLKKLIVTRLEACQREHQLKQSHILEKRMDETEKLNALDGVIFEAENAYRALNEDKTPLTDSEKRVQRTQDELQRLTEKFDMLNARKNELEELLSSNSLDSKIEEKKAKLNSLQSQLKPLYEENARRTNRNDALRMDYQKKSSEAANLSMILKTLRERKETLAKELKGPATQWMALSATQEESRLHEELTQLKQQRQFLSRYVEKMKTQYEITDLEEISRIQNNKNNTTVGRVRTTRATSPTYT